MADAKKKGTLLLVDGNSLLYRSFFAIPRLTNKEGKPTNAVYGLTTTLRKILADEKPDLMVLEDIFSLEKYPKSGIVLGKVCGVLLLAGVQSGVPVAEVPVREAKQILTGNGNASKHQLERAVCSTLGAPAPIRPFHASDALGLALIGSFRYRIEKR